MCTVTHGQPSRVQRRQRESGRGKTRSPLFDTVAIVVVILLCPLILLLASRLAFYTSVLESLLSLSA